MVKAKPIPNFPGYEITTDGRVRSRRRNIAGKWLKPGFITGYKAYRLYAMSQHSQPRKAARLVLETYIGPCPIGMECCHHDGDKSNDSLVNLYWGTHRENMTDMVVHGRCKGNRKLSECQVVIIKRLLTCPGLTGREIANIFNVREATISYIKSGKIWSFVAGGYYT